MASRRSKGNKPEMIHCEYCGEDYSSTYKHCPFCDEMEQDVTDYDSDEYDAPPRPRGGKRLASNTRGGGYGGAPSPLQIIAKVISLGLIVAAVIIVITIVKPLVDKGDTAAGGIPSASPSVESASPSPDSSESPAAGESPNAGESTPPATPSPQIPASQTATGFTLSKTEFSFSDRYPDPITIGVTFTPSGTTGTITWTSEDPDIASVDANGKVSHGTKKGKTTITASMPGAASQTCVVYNQVTGSSSSGSSSSGGSTASGTLSLNKTDFTFSSLSDPSVQMKVNGTSSTPTWSIGNTAVATISSSGVVKPVGSGTTKITCTVDGQTLTCIVRCSF